MFATLGTLVAAVIALASGRVGIPVVAIGAVLALYFTDVLTLPEALAGFGNPIMLFVCSMFIVSEALESTGITSWVGEWVTSHAGTNRSSIIIVTSTLFAVVGAFITPLGAVAALLPFVAAVAMRARIPVAQLILPLTFASHAGALALMTGTPVNPVVSELAASNGGHAFGFAEFSLVAVPLLFITIIITILFGRHLVPDRQRITVSTDLRQHTDHLRQQYEIFGEKPLVSRAEGVAETLVPPRSPLIGESIAPDEVLRGSGLRVLAVRRDGRLAVGGLLVAAGDILLLQGSWDELERYCERAVVIPVDPPHRIRRSVPLGQGARRTILVVAMMIVLLSFDVMPTPVAVALAAGTLLVTRVVTVPRAYHSISWSIPILIAGMIAVSTAFAKSGAASVAADLVISTVGGAGPHFALLAICVLVLILGQFISNLATVLVLAPVAISTATTLDVSIQPFMMGLTVTAAASFLTPVATGANLVAQEAAGYRFGDFWRLGVPLAIIYLFAAVVYVPIIWPF